MTQLDLFATQARDNAINRVRDNSSPDWLADALAAVQHVCRTQAEFTTDDVWQVLTDAPHEPRAMGAIMRDAAKLGLCEATERYRNSSSATCHARPKRVWRSLVFKG